MSSIFKLKHFILHSKSILQANQLLIRTMSSQPIFLQVMSVAVKATDRAAQLVRDIMKSDDLGIVQKTGEKDLQTLADRTANDCIVGSLKKAFKGLSVIGEEGDVDLSKVDSKILVEGFDEKVFEQFSGKISDKIRNATLEELTVWVDPLDGTQEYTEGLLDHVTVLVGIAVGEVATGGVINQPFFNYQSSDANKTLGRTFYGVLGAGVVNLEKVKAPAGERIVTTTRSHSTGLISDVVNSVSPTSVIKVGGSGHKVMLLIEGQAHAYVFPSPGCKKWDTCAPEAILHALGGKMTDIKGDVYKYHTGVQFVDEWGILATGESGDHDDYLKRIPKEMADQVKDYFKKKK